MTREPFFPSPTFKYNTGYAPVYLAGQEKSGCTRGKDLPLTSSCVVGKFVEVVVGYIVTVGVVLNIRDASNPASMLSMLCMLTNGRICR